MKKFFVLAAFWIAATGTCFAVDFPHWDVNVYCEKIAVGTKTAQTAKITRADCIAKQTEARERLKYLQAPQEVAQRCAAQVAANDQGNYMLLHQCIVSENK